MVFQGTPFLPPFDPEEGQMQKEKLSLQWWEHRETGTLVQIVILKNLGLCAEVRNGPNNFELAQTASVGEMKVDKIFNLPQMNFKHLLPSSWLL